MRALGGLGISSGTSLAFESTLLSNASSGINSYLINLRTLIRNARGAFQEDSEKNDVQRVTLGVKDDIEKIAEFINKLHKGKPIEFILYCPSYNGLKSKFPKALLKTPTKEKQKLTAKIEEEVAKKVCEQLGPLIKTTDCQLPTFSGNGVILSHHTVDLVLTNSQTRLWLLESYTGNLKPYTKWYTKLTGKDEELFNLPLNTLTIQIFGDKAVNFLSMDQVKKDLVKEMALKGKWSSATTPSRVRSTIELYAKGADKDGLLLLL